MEPRSRGYRLPFSARVGAFALSSLIISIVVYDKAKTKFPIMGAASFSDERLRLSTEDFDQARSLKTGKNWEQAKGRPVDGTLDALAAPQPPAAITNEVLQADLEKQKARMGIQKIVPAPSREDAAWNALQSAGAADRLAAAPPLPALGDAGAPQLLKDAQPAERPAAAGQPLTDPPAAEATAAQGLLVTSEAERQAAWAERGLHLSPPTVDYARNALVLVFAPDMATAVEILGVDSRAGRLIVRYRQFPRLEALAGARQRAGGPVLSYQFRVLPKSPKPVVFERID